jgi:DNA ligase-1
MELFMKKILFILLLLCSYLFSFELQKAKRYEKQNISGWVISEKLDGIRAYWDGKELYTRKKKKIYAPLWFTKNLPPFALDGELWSKRGDFENIQSIVLSQTPDERWREIKYMIFEVPNAKGNFFERLGLIEAYKKRNLLPFVKIIEQKECHGIDALEKFLQEVMAFGGEGVMVKNPKLSYWDGRSDGMYKVKQKEDAEAVVIGYKEGEGKYKGMVGSLHLRMEDGREFFLGSGLSDKERKNPPKIGETITFAFYGKTKDGIPKFASFLRVRGD